MTLTVIQILTTIYISGVVVVALVHRVELILGDVFTWGTYKSPVKPAKVALLWPLFLLNNFLRRVLK
jgi:hypothetical protein